VDFHQLIDIMLHLNLYVGDLVQKYHFYTIIILMGIIFCETGLVIAPFLPGDSLLFAAGLVFSTTEYNIIVICLLLVLATFLGDNSNYWIGRFLGRRVCGRYPQVFKPSYLAATEAFYLRYGFLAIVFSRFLPILRTFIPFFAGLSKMSYLKYLAASLISAILWVFAFTLAGYFFGNIAWVQNNFTLVITGIIAVSMLPGIYEFIAYHCYKKKKLSLEAVEPKE
jgi:membrane-associated protein